MSNEIQDCAFVHGVLFHTAEIHLADKLGLTDSARRETNSNDDSTRRDHRGDFDATIQYLLYLNERCFVNSEEKGNKADNHFFIKRDILYSYKILF